jgi:hypothetical protein
MTRLEVLVIESDPGVGESDARALEAAGHRVHYCYRTSLGPAPGRVATRDRYLCTGVTEGACPLEQGIDVALLVRQRPLTRPGAREGGVSCALRADVPVVEDGPDLLDPFEPWLAGRATGDADVASTCEAAASASFDPLLDAIRARTRQLLVAASIDPSSVTCRFATAWPRLHVMLAGPPIPDGLEQALAVRVLDAVRADGRTFGQIDVGYETAVDT